MNDPEGSHEEKWLVWYQDNLRSYKKYPSLTDHYK